jgi:hypothetical protein
MTALLLVATVFALQFEDSLSFKITRVKTGDIFESIGRKLKISLKSFYA